VDIEEKESFVMNSRESKELLLELATDRLYSRLYAVLDCYGPIRVVVEACAKMDESWRTNSGFFESSEAVMRNARNATWEKVFCGGTGLFYSIRRSNQDNLEVMRSELKACSSEFIRLAATSAKLAADEWELFRSKTLTKAGFIGLLMAYRRVASKSLNYEEGHDAFIRSMKRIDWIHGFQPFVLALAKTSYLKDLDPKAWTIFRDIILIFTRSENGVSLDSGCQEAFERNLFLYELDLIVKGHASSRGVAVQELRDAIPAQRWTDDLTKESFDGWVKAVRQKIEGVFSAAELKCVNEDWTYDYGQLNK
jgi:hypothetical protein